MNSRYRSTLLACTVLLAVFALGRATTTSAQPAGRALSISDNILSDIKLVLYVSDVRQSVAYYHDVLGFEFHHYYDPIDGGEPTTWEHDEPPIYAEMVAGNRKFGLHLPQNADDRAAVGRNKVYFRVADLERHYGHIDQHAGEPSSIVERSWMHFFHVRDPDGHRIYFAYSDDEVHGNPWTESR